MSLIYDAGTQVPRSCEDPESRTPISVLLQASIMSILKRRESVLLAGCSIRLLMGTEFI